MSKYITRRLLLVIPLALGITFINFAMYNAAPGDPILMLINPEERYTLSEEQIEYFRHKLGLDQPLPIRYVKWLGRIVRGDMGYSVSVQPGHQVSELIWRSLPQTIELMWIPNETKSLRILAERATRLRFWRAARVKSLGIKLNLH